MRSRYSAYVLRDVNYLKDTWDESRRPKAIDFSKETIHWLRLEIIDVKKGSLKDINGRWFYLDGVIKSMGRVNSQANQGKNADCVCGSGKKFKRCCGAGSS